VSPIDVLSGLLVLAGAAFFLAGTVGLLRFPDVFSRLHALTKADNVGLGLVAVGLAVRSPSPLAGARILFIWMLVLVATAAASHLMARAALKAGLSPEVG